MNVSFLSRACFGCLTLCKIKLKPCVSFVSIILQSWRSGDDMTSEARPKGAPSSADAEKRNEAWLGTQSLVRDGMVENRKVPKAALNLPADTEIASISGFDGKSATVLLDVKR